ncbi:MAG: hypothetical protein ACFFER_15380, partial [Candidatus Thorarchaeota archaeon]
MDPDDEHNHRNLDQHRKEEDDESSHVGDAPKKEPTARHMRVSQVRPEETDEIGAEIEVLESEASLKGIDFEVEDAFAAGSASLLYLRGVLDNERMNLDDAIRNLTGCFESAVESDFFEYVVKSQAQLASVHLKRFQIHDNEADYISALQYSENLIQISVEQNLRDLQMESLILRAILRKISRDYQYAMHDLKAAKEIAENLEQHHVCMMISMEMKEVRRLKTRLSRAKRLGKADEEQVMVEALERMPAVVNGVLGIELARKVRVVPVELFRLIVMNLPAGLPLYTYSFQSDSFEEQFLIYGLLSAVSHLVSEVAPAAGRIRSLSHEDQTVMMEHRGKYMAALFANKESFRARQCLERFLRDFLRLLGMNA